MSNQISVQEILNAQHDSTVSVPRYEAYSFNNITTSAQNLIKSGAGVLGAVVVNTTLVSAVRGYDNTVSGGATVFTIAAGQTAITLPYKIKLANGLVVSSGAAADNLTIAYL